MSRVLLTIALCLGFPSAQQHVIEGRRAALVQQAAGQPDHAPDHDWRRTGGGTTRAVGQRSVVERAPAWAAVLGGWSWTQREDAVAGPIATWRPAQIALAPPRPLRL